VKNVLVLISGPAHPALNDGAIKCAVDVLRAQGATVGAPDWLAPDVACDIPFDMPFGGPSSGVTMTALDGVVVPAAGRRKKLLLADMESTMIENEMLDELAEFLGLREKIAGITARAMNGEIDFAGALTERVGLLKGLPVAKLDEAARRIRYMPGGATLVATMKRHGAYCALVSGGFTHFTALVKQALGFDSDAANVLTYDGDTLAGTVETPIVGKEAKLATLRRLAAEQGLSTADAVSVGDGANDLPMLKAAGLGVAFHAKPVVAAQVPTRIDHGDLTSLLYLQGYRLTDFVERKDP
jgi:phosphoserine phosphatase